MREELRTMVMARDFDAIERARSTLRASDVHAGRAAGVVAAWASDRRA
ncbi:MAG: hypothetical protein AAGA48_03530 [Myxococcota bacterium]